MRFKRNLKKKLSRFKPLSRHAQPRKPESQGGAHTIGKTNGSDASPRAELLHPKGLQSLSTINHSGKPSPSQPGAKTQTVQAQHEEFCLVAFKKTKNNTYCTLSRLFGLQRTLWTISGGHASGSKVNGRRKTRFTQRMVLKYAFEKLLGLGFKYLVIHCSGSAISKRYLFKNFYKRFKIVLLKDLTGVPHNGCRASNVRRK